MTRVPAKFKSTARMTGASFSSTVQMAGKLAGDEQKQLKQTLERKEKVRESNVKDSNELSLLQFFFFTTNLILKYFFNNNHHHSIVTLLSFNKLKTSSS